jgi:polo-like kinase 1
MPNYNSNKDNESNNEENKNNNISNEITDDTENNNNEKSSTSKTRIPLYINGTFSSKMEVWVTKWIDYSSKYGLGYILNNGYYGVYFNDNTKMLLNPFDERFIFVERKISEKQDSLFQFFLKDYPSDLKNKITLFIQFKKFLEENNSNKKKEIVNRNVSPTLRDKRKREKINIKEPENIEVPKIEESNVDFSSIEVKESDFIFIKKWMNTKHAIIFRFSNKIIQTIFKDKTQIIIHGLINKVTYINKKEEKFVYLLNKVFESNNYEMIRRVKYIKEILEHMVNLNKENTKVKDDQKEKELIGSTPASTPSGTTTDKSQIEKETPKGNDKVKEEKQ